MGKLNEVDNQAKMAKLVEKLPGYLQGRWRQRAVQTLESEGKYPDIVLLSRFVDTAARELNDPVFGCSDGTGQRGAKATVPQVMGQRGQGTSFNIQARSESLLEDENKADTVGQLSCHLCREKHPLTRCEKFKEMTPDKRQQFVKEKTLCFNCFSSKHRSNVCPKDSRCSIQGCSLTHSKLLHIPFNQRRQTDPKKRNGAGVHDAKVHSSTCNVAGSFVPQIALPIVPVKVRASGSEHFVSTFALLDNGSTNTFCSQELVDRLRARGTSTTLILTTLGKEKQPSNTKVIPLEVSDLNERLLVSIPRVYSTPKLPILKDNVIDNIDLQRWSHLEGINFPKIDGGKVTLLIGQDSPILLMPTEIRAGKENEPYATRTSLGWTLNGPLHVPGRTAAVSHFVQADVDLHAQVERFWKLETSEGLVDSGPHFSVEDSRVTSIWENSIQIVDGHYQMDILFKSKQPCLPNNYHLAKVRLESLGKKLDRNPQMFERYKSEMHALLDKGYAEKVPKEELLSDNGKIWYLPHHGVTTEKKPEKLRIVFDCAAKYDGVSLNDQVLQGPDMTNTLMGVLLRFREKKVAIMGDVEGMFHQVKVTPTDRDVLRFLWWKDDDTTKEPDVYRMTVHLFGGVWSPSCASFAMRRTAIDHVTEYDTDVVQTVINNFYVDDCLKSGDTVDEAVCMVEQLSSLLQKGGFRITKLVSNKSEVLESVPVERRAKDFKELGVRPLPAETALGVYWQTEEAWVQDVV